MTEQPRAATPADFASMVAMGRSFFEMSPYASLGSYSEAGAEAFLRHIIASPTATLITNGQGMIAGTMARLPFAPEAVVAEEAFWWARHGGRDLLRAFEAQAKDRGASATVLTTLADERGKAAARLAELYGYRPVEVRHMKVH